MSGIIGISPNMRSGVVGKYPVGHVVQMTGGQASAGTGTMTSDTLVNAPTLTLRSSSNHVNICWTMLGAERNTNGSSYLQVYLVGGGLGSTDASGRHVGDAWMYGMSESARDGASFQTKDTNPGTSATYGIYFDNPPSSGIEVYFINYLISEIQT